MSMSTIVVGFKPPDAKWKKMKKVWDVCKEEGVTPPAEVEDFFDNLEGGLDPSDLGVQISGDVLLATGAVVEYRADGAAGFDILVDKLPKDVTVIRVYNGW